MEKLLSIVIASYNSKNYIHRCLLSIERFTDFDGEIIIIDDCSVDDSYDFIIDYANKSSLDIRVIRNIVNSGPGVTRNRGIDYANGKYIAFCDSDDYFSTDFWDNICPLLQSNYDCVVFDYSKVQEDDSLISNGKILNIKNISGGIVDKRKVLAYINGAPWGKVYKTEIIKNNEVIFLNQFRSEDLPFTKHAVALSETIFYCDKPMYNYVQVSTSIMHNNSLRDVKNSQIAFQYLRTKLSSMGYQEELNIIELRDVIITTVLIMISKGENKRVIRNYIRETFTKNHIRNRYLKSYPLYIRILSHMVYRKCFFLLKIATNIKEKKSI